MDDGPVLVAGAGPVGLATALALRARDIPVVLLEADSQDRVRPGSRALYVHHDSLKLLESLRDGVGKRLAEHGIIWNVRRTTYRGREVYARTYPPYDKKTGLPPFTSLRQADTERILLHACVQAGVTVQWDSRVTSVAPRATDVTVSTADGTSWTASHVVAADGARSVIRMEAGIGLQGSTSPGFHVVIDINGEEQCLERVFHYRHPAMAGRHVLTVPYTGGFQVDLQCKADDRPDIMASPEAVREWLPGVIGAVDEQRITWISVYKFRQLIADSFADETGRVLLVGEAAHLFPPFGARGMNSGFADADAAAAAIAYTRRELATSAISEFSKRRRTAAMSNSAAAGAALKHMRPSGSVARGRQLTAALLAPVVPRFGEWLERAPYGPVSTMVTGY
ncbi:3-(3-hydroxy-phenyl)propionate hydroxylase [Kibdelosporangium banguiense]|uniref:3-(3-hydroxy-phenyl)propionate hydroxylase n=1 Tax=Kibdelosporangium banguiense TaxID=1365924 RepID=A0ABS4TZ40_9PSEU|nr:FAD-dependent monooxygenase [Kibdelosporangium banguiense]MBP2329683.1 3-(3-hydroxy-phenyl)propionate hydroxylase [Kibdelosporangium banguiense]